MQDSRSAPYPPLAGCSPSRPDAGWMKERYSYALGPSRGLTQAASACSTPQEARGRPGLIGTAPSSTQLSAWPVPRLHSQSQSDSVFLANRKTDISEARPEPCSHWLGIAPPLLAGPYLGQLPPNIPPAPAPRQILCFPSLVAVLWLLPGGFCPKKLTMA